MWDLLHSRPIFRARRVNGEYDDGHHLAEMIAIIGPPPLDFLKRSEENTLYWWDETGRVSCLVPLSHPVKVCIPFAACDAANLL